MNMNNSNQISKLLSPVELDKAMDQLYVNKSRRAIRARTESELSKYALRIVALITLLLKNKQEESILTINMKDIEGFIGNHSGAARESIIRALKELVNVKYEIYQDNFAVGQLMYLQDYIHDTVNNKITLRLDRASADILFSPEGGYGKILWIYTFGMKSKYGQKFYELIVLEKFRTTRHFTITISELRSMLGLQNKYPNIANFKKYVLEQGIVDINTYTPFKIQYNIQKDLVTIFIEEKTKNEIEEIHNNILKNKQIIEIINSYNTILNSSESISDSEYTKSKRTIVENSYLLGSTPKEKLLIANNIEED